MEDNGLIIRSIIAGIIGGEFADWVARRDKKIKLPFIVVYSLCFTIIFSLALMFFGVVYFLFDIEIPWAKFSIFVICISILISTVLRIIDGKKNEK